MVVLRFNLSCASFYGVLRPNGYAALRYFMPSQRTSEETTVQVGCCDWSEGGLFVGLFVGVVYVVN